MDSQISAIIAAVGTIGGLASLLVAIRARRFARAVAQAQRVFESPALKFAVFGERNKVNEIHIALPFRPNRVVDFPLMLTLSNVGEKTASDVLLSVRCSKGLRFGGAPGHVAGLLPNVRITQVEEENFCNTLTELSLIHPNSNIELIDRISLRKATRLKSTVTGETKDGVKVDVTWSAEYGYTIDFIVQYRDAKPISRQVTVQVHDLGEMSPREYFRDRNAAIERRASQRRSSSLVKSGFASWWRRPQERARSQADGGPYKFVLLFVTEPLNQHRKFTDLPLDEVVAQAVRGAEGLRFGDQVFIPAIGVAPSGIKWRQEPKINEIRVT